MKTKRKIYVYSTKTYVEKNYAKIGETIRDIDTRIKEQDTTSNPEPLERLRDSKGNLMEFESYLTDDDIRQSLYLKGYDEVRKDTKREWVGGWKDLTKNPDEIVTEISKIIRDSENDTRITYFPYFYKEYISGVFRHFLDKDADEDYIDVALELAPRFGKTTWMISEMIHLFNNRGYKFCVLPSYWLSTHTSFDNDLTKWKGFDKYVHYVGRDDSIEEAIDKWYGKKMIVLEVSLFMNNFEKKMKPVIDLPTDEKISMIDEADFGVPKKNQIDNITKLDCRLNVYLSGTAINKVSMNLNNLRNNIARFSYTDMLLVRNGEHPLFFSENEIGYDEELNVRKRIANELQTQFTADEMIGSCKKIVTPRFFYLNLGDPIKRHEELSENLRSRWTKLLSDVDENRGQLSDIILATFGKYGGMDEHLINANSNSHSPKDCTMIFASTRTNTELGKLAKLMRDVLGKKNYDVFLMNSNYTSNREAEEDVKKRVARAKRLDRKLVILSSNMGSRSFSIPEIDTVMLWYDKGSVSATSQKISRALTPGKMWNGERKEFANILSFSFDPNREESTPIDDYLLSEAEKIEDDDLQDSVQRVLRSAYIFGQDKDGLIIEFTEDDKINLSKRLVTSSSLLSVAEAGVDAKAIDFESFFNSIDTSNSVDKKKLEGFTGKINVSKGKQKRGKSEPNEERSDYLVTLRVLQNIVKKSVNLSLINNFEDDDFVKMLESIKRKGYQADVVFEVGVKPELIIEWAERGAFNLKLMNTIINTFNSQNKVAEKNLDFS